MKFKRVFLIVMDSLGVGEAIDASNYGDVGASTLGHIKEKEELFIPNLTKLGFLDTCIENIKVRAKVKTPRELIDQDYYKLGL